MTMQRFRTALDPHELRDFTMRETAEITGLTEHTLRYYEKVGLLPRVRRDPASGHRRYSSIDLVRIEALSCLRMIGMPIEDMRRYGSLDFEDRKNSSELMAILERQRDVLERRKAEIDETLRYVDMKTGYLAAIQSGDETQISAAAKRMKKKLASIEARAERFS